LEPVIFVIILLAFIHNWFYRPLIFLAFEKVRAIVRIDPFLFFNGLLFFLFAAPNCRQKSGAFFLIYHHLLNYLCLLCLLLWVVLFPTSLHSHYVEEVLLFFEHLEVIVILFDLVLLLGDVTF
jgi:hypothetical protein